MKSEKAVRNFEIAGRSTEKAGRNSQKTGRIFEKAEITVIKFMGNDVIATSGESGKGGLTGKEDDF